MDRREIINWGEWRGAKPPDILQSPDAIANPPLKKGVNAMTYAHYGIHAQNIVFVCALPSLQIQSFGETWGHL